MANKLFYLLLGCTPAGRHTEQHDVFFCIGRDLKDIIPDIKVFWPESGKIHIDSWREVTAVDGFRISITEKQAIPGKHQQLFFINLGGYLPGSFEEHHYKLLTVAADMSQAIRNAKQTSFYKDYNTENKSGVSHVDDKYGVDVDEILNVADILPAYQKERFSIILEPGKGLVEDALHIGYLKLDKI
ncbi:DUF1543 domain-containing protein [Niabella yanshanensis]|uniref:DUF1543 domain-containing protein n=1 Tax=Niabella yanshanensis TaxID=577386 RepID=A0ABZ0WBP3_9BACT|nr:DUF1543 domain-containing protein [Niabella yanshanensis]WQD40389.1 DUF1543 domain-containing protein [Niabella yanshanensis]